MDKIKLVIVDDSQVDIDIMKKVVDGNKQQCILLDCFTSSKKAKEKLPELRPDLILLDFDFINDLNGIQLLDYLRNDSVKIIFITHHQYMQETLAEADEVETALFKDSRSYEKDLKIAINKFGLHQRQIRDAELKGIKISEYKDPVKLMLNNKTLITMDRQEVMYFEKRTDDAYVTIYSVAGGPYQVPYNSFKDAEDHLRGKEKLESVRDKQGRITINTRYYHQKLGGQKILLKHLSQEHIIECSRIGYSNLRSPEDYKYHKPTE